MTNEEVKHSLNWLLTDFCERVAGVAHGFVASSDGIPLAVSGAIAASYADRLCALTPELTALTEGAAKAFGGGMVIHALVATERGLLLVKPASGGSALAVLATPECDQDLVGYELAILAEAVGDILA